MQFSRSAWLWVECVVIYVICPFVFAHPVFHRLKLPALYALLAIALTLAHRTTGTWRPLLQLGTVRSWLPHILWRGILAAVVILAVAWWLGPEHILRFPRTRPLIWCLVMLLYPILSAYPQELIYRSCFYVRYAQLFPSPRAMIIASSIAFAWLHIVFWNLPSLVLSFLGGVLLSHTYWRTRSTLAVSIEHAVYGCLVFTLGVGRYFYLPIG